MWQQMVIVFCFYLEKDVVMNLIKKLVQKYGHIWTALYLPVYLIWFFKLERDVTREYTVIHCFIDDYIPFCEYFIVPYLLWFLMIPVMWLYLFFKDKKEFYQHIIFLYSGMTLFLIICTIFPNGQDMRPVFNPTENIFTELIAVLYRSDTSTNVFPSIHVFNSLAFYIAVRKNKTLNHNLVIRIGSLILTVSICLATVFLKQHSVLDGIGAGVLAMVLYYFVYVKPEKSTYALKEKKKVKARKHSLQDNFFY